MKRINHLVNLINNAKYIIDVGSDHSYLAINTLKQNKTKYAINIEINRLPLYQGIKNLTKNNLIQRTRNIINNGLENIDRFLDTNIKYDYLIISGMGANNIINILEKNILNINTFILQPNNNTYLLRKYLINHHYKIIKEDIVLENHIYYPIIIAKKCVLKQIYNKLDLYFGKLNKVVNYKLYYEFLCHHLTYLKTKIDIKKNEDMIYLIQKMIKKYESKWNI